MTTFHLFSILETILSEDQKAKNLPPEKKISLEDLE